jgi:hypothetical protein
MRRKVVTTVAVSNHRCAPSPAMPPAARPVRTTASEER